MRILRTTLIILTLVLAWAIAVNIPMFTLESPLLVEISIISEEVFRHPVAALAVLIVWVVGTVMDFRAEERSR